jgi:geranylgeranyl pyrophosphate synthase
MIATDELDLVEGAFRKAIESDVTLLAKASGQFVCSGGKGLRPKIVLLSYKAAGGDNIRQAVPLAAAVELLHTASLIHDDINDRSDMRRGQPSVNARWGDGLALLIGDFVFVRLLS